MLQSGLGICEEKKSCIGTHAEQWHDHMNPLPTQDLTHLIYMKYETWLVILCCTEPRFKVAVLCILSAKVSF